MVRGNWCQELPVVAHSIQWCWPPGLMSLWSLVSSVRQKCPCKQALARVPQHALPYTISHTHATCLSLTYMPVQPVLVSPRFLVV